MLNENEYADVIAKKLMIYRKVRVPTISEKEAKYILADLISRGFKVRYENGFFVLEGFSGKK
jgi:hypothetical protein